MLMCASASATNVAYNGSAFRSATVYADGKYTYSYSLDLWKLTSQELQSFNVFWCGGATGHSFNSSIEFDSLDKREDQVIFYDFESDDDDDDDDDGNETITFSFKSINAPVDGIVTYKAGATTWQTVAKVPCAAIPEPSSALLLGLSTLLLTYRRR